MAYPVSALARMLDDFNDPNAKLAVVRRRRRRKPYDPNGGSGPGLPLRNSRKGDPRTPGRVIKPNYYT